MLDIDTVSNKQKHLPKKAPANPGNGVESDLHSCHIIRFKSSVFNNNKLTRHLMKLQSMIYSKEIHKSTETVSEKDLKADLLYKDFKRAILKMLREVMDAVQKPKKTMSEQNGAINKERTPKRNQKEIMEQKVQ